MKDNAFSIGDYYDLLNLHKALLESRFHQGLDNKYLAGSPVIARIHSQIIDKLGTWEMERKGSEGWTEWRKISNRKDYLEIAVNNIIKFEDWDRSSHIETIKNYISPFTATEEEIIFIEEYVEKKIDKVDNHHSFENGICIKGYYLNMIDELYDLVLSENGLAVEIKYNNFFDEEKYNRIKYVLIELVEEWKIIKEIPPKAVIAIIELTSSLASDCRFLDNREALKVVDAEKEIKKLLNEMNEEI